LCSRCGHCTSQPPGDVAIARWLSREGGDILQRGSCRRRSTSCCWRCWCAEGIKAVPVGCRGFLQPRSGASQSAHTQTKLQPEPEDPVSPETAALNRLERLAPARICCAAQRRVRALPQARATGGVFVCADCRQQPHSCTSKALTQDLRVLGSLLPVPATATHTQQRRTPNSDAHPTATHTQQRRTPNSDAHSTATHTQQRRTLNSDALSRPASPTTVRHCTSGLGVL
jgi:hypothetical protein